ncbi:MAG: hypothetical protein WAU86_15995 [Oricola sp.]
MDIGGIQSDRGLSSGEEFAFFKWKADFQYDVNIGILSSISGPRWPQIRLKNQDGRVLSRIGTPLATVG